MERVSKQLILSTQSGRLKPDVRLGVAVSDFAQTLDDDRKREFQKMQTAGAQLSGRDAIRVTEELNRDSELRHCTWRPYGTKCGKFLDRLQTLANIGDVMIGGSQNVIATSVWCAVRLSLQTATNFRGYFERLSNLFMKLGTSWELHNDFAKLFPQSEALQTFLCEYLIVLMRLCRKAVLFSSKSLAGQLWSSLGASFDSEFKPLQEEMDNWGLMIQYKTQQLATASLFDAKKFRRRNYKQRTLHLLSPNQPQHITTWRRHRRKGECKWIYQTAAYKAWIAEDESSSLCISGKLGSGKTVMMANIVAQINVHQTCAFFFCTFKEQESLTARAVLGSIAFHLLDSIPSDDSTWNLLSRKEDTMSQVLTSAGIIDLLMEILPQHAKYVLLFDGIEDCPKDEITEVICGIRRVIACRTVLLCYSARSGSMFQRLAAQDLATRFSISLDEDMHDGEIKAYIAEEIARRKQTSQPGLFSDELIELVKQQLLAGAQGMYLWVSLQLESIFPSQSRTVVTYEQILNLINNLPKDLPEAFERALEEIIDDRYGDSIMKLVMASPSPLSLDELTVALAVVPGDPVWYPSKVPTNASQLISLCGGNLLELDEEDEKVRFIHYSVVSHLLQPTKNPRTMLYHFTLQEAVVQSGAICVTFLNMPIFESAITTTRKIDGERLAEEVIGTATHGQPLLGRLAHLFKMTDRRHSRSTDFDIGRLLAEIQAARMFKFDPHCFQDYAVSNWLPHSRAFREKTPLCIKSWHLWMRLVCGNIQVAKPPFQSPVEESWPALSWALKHYHIALIFALFEEPTTEPTDGDKISQEVVKLASSLPGKLCHSSTLGLILVHLFQLATKFLIADPKFEDDHGIVGHTDASKSKVPWKFLYQSLQQLLQFGADHTIPHSRNGKMIPQMLLEILGCISETTADGVQLCILLTRILQRHNTAPWLRSTWVPYALRGILQNDNTQIFSRLLSYHPKLLLEPEEDSLVGVAVARSNAEAVRGLIKAWKAWPEGGLGPAKGSPPSFQLPVRASYINGRPAIELALEMQNKEMVEILAGLGGLRHFTGRKESSVPLLQIALGLLSAEWIEQLLQLGAKPNVSYRALIEEPLPHTEFRYPLQIAAERGQTLKFLTLVRYGADPFLPASPSIKNMILHRDNRVLRARLEEIAFSDPKKHPTAWEIRFRHGLSPPSALLEACKILALNVHEYEILHQFGVIQWRDIGIQANGRELKLILLDLAKTTQPDRLNLQCEEGNTALHYLTGGMNRFHLEALAVASALLASELVRPGLIQLNTYSQTPLHRAIDNGSRNGWRPPYIDSILFLLYHLRRENSLKERLNGDDRSILGFAISKSAPIDKVIKRLLYDGFNPNGTLQGATALEIAVKMPEFRYASIVTACLLAYGADPSVKCSFRRSLLDIVGTKRRDWLQDLLSKLRPSQANETLPYPSVFEGPDALQLIVEGKDELESTNTSKGLDDVAERSRTSTPDHQTRTRSLSPKFCPEC